MASETTKDEAIKFLESAVRNWSHVPRLSNDDIDDVRVALNSFRRAAVAELVECLRKISAGGYDRPLGKRWRADEKPSKLDMCAHDIPMSDDCGVCISEFADATLARHQAGLGKGDERG